MDLILWVLIGGMAVAIFYVWKGIKGEFEWIKNHPWHFRRACKKLGL